jgi:hypothetical protein
VIRNAEGTSAIPIRRAGSTYRVDLGDVQDYVPGGAAAVPTFRDRSLQEV